MNIFTKLITSAFLLFQIIQQVQIKTQHPTSPRKQLAESQLHKSCSKNLLRCTRGRRLCQIWRAFSQPRTTRRTVSGSPPRLAHKGEGTTATATLISSIGKQTIPTENLMLPSSLNLPNPAPTIHLYKWTLFHEIRKSTFSRAFPIITVIRVAT